MKSRHENGNAILTLSQEKFNLNGILSEEDKKMLWPIPISIITSSSEKPVVDTLMEDRSMELTLKLGPNDWFKLNPTKVGVYRIQYQEEHMKNFTTTMNSLKPLDRLDLLSDTNAMVMSGKQQTIVLLNLLNSFRSETDYNVWCTIGSIFSKFYQLLSDTPFYSKFFKACRSMINESIFPKLGWEPKENEPYLDTLLRTLLINRLVVFEDKKVLAECRKRFDEYLLNGKEIPADLRTAVYRGVTTACDDKIYDIMIEVRF